ncbi:permease [Alteromonas gracilis]
MTTQEAAGPGTGTTPRASLGWQGWLVVGVVVMLTVARGPLAAVFDGPRFSTWATVLTATVLQALPFLVFGVLLAGIVAAFVTEDRLKRWLPSSPVTAVPVAGAAGIALPGCECASVPLAGSLMKRGVAPSAALTFLLAAPAVNPIVIASTAVAFAGRWDIVGARFAASMITAIAVGWLWAWRFGRVPIRLDRLHQHDHGPRWLGLLRSMRHDLLNAGGYLVLGAMIAAGINTLLPRPWLDAVAGMEVVAILALAVFAFVVAMCSEADAFIAASLTAFSDTAKLVFMVVGPAIDVKIASLEAGILGGSFARVFAPLSFVVALASAVLVGWVVL